MYKNNCFLKVYRQSLYKTKYYIKMFLNIFEEYSSSSKLEIDYDNSILFLLACDYNNIGDVLIRMSQEDYLNNHAKGKRVITIGFNDTYKYLKDIRRHATENTIIALTGGGDVDDRYTSIERTRNRIIRALRKNRCLIVSFPQTINYSNTKKGRFYLRKAQKTYSLNHNFVFFAREKKSYSIAQNDFSTTRSFLVPDIVFSHKTIESNYERSGIGLLIRNDSEKSINNMFLQQITDRLALQHRIYNNDMTVREFQKEKISEYSQEKINFALKRKLILTDRLHGMILCYITNTPCIAFMNSNHKIVETYNYILHGRQNFIIMEKNTEIQQVINDIKKLLSLTSIKKKSIDGKFKELDNCFEKEVRLK